MGASGEGWKEGREPCEQGCLGGFAPLGCPVDPMLLLWDPGSSWTSFPFCHVEISMELNAKWELHVNFAVVVLLKLLSC